MSNKTKQFAVIGIGKFGYYLASYLYQKGNEVVAIDKVPERIQEIKDEVSQAVVADAADKKAIETLGLNELDAVVICTASQLSESILIALNLHDLGVEKLYAKAISEAHLRILHKIGVSEVFFPERDTAVTLAERLHYPNILDYLPFTEGYSIIHMVPPDQFIGKSLRELNLINRFGVQVVAVKEIIPDRVHMIPKADFVLKDSDIMILLGANESLEKLQRFST